MDKCEVCGEEGDIRAGVHVYCAVHYVENEDEECLFWNFYALMEKQDLSMHENNLLVEIKKKYPGFMKRYDKTRREELYDFLSNLSEKEINSLIELKGIGFLNKTDKEEKVMILLTEPIKKVESCLIKLSHNKLRNDLIIIYEAYLKNPTDKALKRKAQNLHQKFLNAMPLLNKSLQHALDLLVDIGWDLPAPAKPTKAQIRKVLRRLKGVSA